MSRATTDRTSGAGPRGEPRSPRGWPFWVGVAVGLPVMAYGALGLFDAASATRPANLLTFFAGLAILHDLVVAPLVVGAGWLVARTVPAWARVPVWLALAATGLLVLVTWPLVRAWGRREANPSLLPFDYGTRVLWSVVAVWLTAAAVVGWRAWHRRRATP